MLYISIYIIIYTVVKLYINRYYNLFAYLCSMETYSAHRKQQNTHLFQVDREHSPAQIIY